MVDVSEDIFYQVKKEILDKLDVILQKINLELINYLRPEELEFSFIELASFEAEISILFRYLDRLYASLNSSVSFSSIASFKSNCEAQQLAYKKLEEQNFDLKQMIAKLNEKNMQIQKSLHNSKLQKQQKQSSVKRVFEIANNQHGQEQLSINEKIRDLRAEYRNNVKYIRKSLKEFKFQLLESRVEVIAKLKEFEVKHCERDGRAKCSRCNMKDDKQEILEAINDIIKIC